ncbi:hypothetical protein [Limnohabitans sp.]|uniref:hypothetical protein n=1 Tax=Limnohabitans sp. TaxID=1907725 RepID=UPI003862133D
MLPEQLSNNLISLNPNEIRLVLINERRGLHLEHLGRRNADCFEAVERRDTGFGH